jgi:hypothetical protein
MKHGTKRKFKHRLSTVPPIQRKRIKKTKTHLSNHWTHSKNTTTTNGVGNLGSCLGQAQNGAGLNLLIWTQSPLDNWISNGNNNNYNKSRDVISKNKIHFQIIFMILLVSWRSTWSVVVSLKLLRQWSSPELKDTNWNTPLCSLGR